jgi:hypothetical protein
LPTKSGLENQSECCNINFMSKLGKNTFSNTKTKDGYRVVGQARDGVWIIKPSLRPTHFSAAEAAASVRKVLRESGQLREAASGLNSEAKGMK